MVFILFSAKTIQIMLGQRCLCYCKDLVGDNQVPNVVCPVESKHVKILVNLGFRIILFLAICYERVNEICLWDGIFGLPTNPLTLL